MKTQKKHGFSLIELLIVIVIIATLMGFLFPTFLSSREQAQCVKDASQLNQITKAYAMYLSDHDGFAVPCTNLAEEDRVECITKAGLLPGKDENYVSWVVRLHPYTKSKEVFIGPNVSLKKFTDQEAIKTTLLACYPSWGYNGCYFSPQKIKTRPPTVESKSCSPIQTSLIDAPTQTVLFASSIGHGDLHCPPGDEAGYYLIVPPSYTTYWTGDKKNNKYQCTGSVWPRFQNGKACNVAFADGHVKTIPLDKLKDEKLWQVEKGTMWNK